MSFKSNKHIAKWVKFLVSAPIKFPYKYFMAQILITSTNYTGETLLYKINDIHQYNNKYQNKSYTNSQSWPLGVNKSIQEQLAMRDSAVQRRE